MYAQKKSVGLRTIAVRIKTKEGKEARINALLDDGAVGPLISEEVVKKLGGKSGPAMREDKGRKQLRGLAQRSKEETSLPGGGVHLACCSCVVGVKGRHPSFLVRDRLA